MSGPTLDLKDHQLPTPNTRWRRRFMQMMGISAVSAVVMVAGCTGRVGDETVVETLSMESSTTVAPPSSTTTPDVSTTRPPTSIGAGVGATTSSENPTSGLRGLSSSSDEADAWTSTSIVAAPPASTSTSSTSAPATTTTVIATTPIAPTSTTALDATTTTSTEAEAAETEAAEAKDGDDTDEADEALEADVDDLANGDATTSTTAVATPAPQTALASNWSGPATVAHVVVDTVGVYQQPGSQTGPSGADWTFESKTQFGSPTTFLVVGSSGDWHEVLLPVRQKHTRGWIHSSQIQTTTHNYHATVSVSSRRVVVYDNGVPVKDTGVVVGKSSTPTPLGRFYVTDKLRHANPGGAYGPWILALSARSEALTTFNGGEPIVALHGTNKPWLVGGGHSNGCIRMPNDVITKLAEFVPLGTPVDIVA